MKLKNILLTLGLLLVVLAACDKDEDKGYIAPEKAPVLSPISESLIYTIDADELDKVVRFSWTPASFGFDQTAITYKVKIWYSNVKEKDIEPLILDATNNATNLELTNGDFNDLLISKLKCEAGTPNGLQATVIASILVETGTVAKEFPSLESDPIKMTIIPAKIAPKVPQAMFLIGNMFGVNVWDNANKDFIMFRENPEDKVSTYTGLFKAGAEFKIIPEASLGTWDNLFGDGGNGTVSQDGGAGNLHPIEKEGYYTFTFDTEKLTYTVEPYNASSIKEFSHISLIGDAVGGWDKDLDLKQSSYDPHIWIGHNIQLNQGEVKIRANHDWAENWGGETFLYGQGIGGGANIKISADEAGVYMVVFNALTKHYVFFRIEE